MVACGDGWNPRVVMWWLEDGGVLRLLLVLLTPLFLHVLLVRLAFLLLLLGALRGTNH